jgi:4'-phosphopantetheinyl transferase
MSRPKLPAAGEVHLRFASLVWDLDGLAHFERLLGTDELLRAGRLRSREARDRFVAGRGLLRETLAACLGQDPAMVRLAMGEFGKPRLADREEGGGLRFNLSHSGDLCLVAVAVGREVGVDLELVRDDLPFREMAARFFSQRERDELFGLPEDEQLAAFYRGWTRKEAYLKGCGSGFSQPADACDVSLLPSPAALLAHRTAPGEPAAWTITDLPVPPGYCAALAVAGVAPVLRWLSSPEFPLAH